MGGNLGDNLWITPVLRNLDNPVLVIPPHCTHIASLFKGISSVEYSDNIERYNLSNKEHSTKQLLDRFNINYKNKNIIPKIKLYSGEVKWAKNFLKDYDNPIVFVNDNIGCHTPDNFAAKYRRPNPERIQELCDVFSKKNTILQFGLKENHFNNGLEVFTPLKNAIHIRGLSIRETAACYFVIGKYIGGDTGDYHLMLSTGGQCIVFVPPENPAMGYIYSSLLYTKDFWGKDKPRVKYFTGYCPKEMIENNIKFDA